MSRYSLLRKVSATTSASALIGGIRMSSSSHADPESTPVFDLLVIGGGSGGISCGEIMRKEI